jgi:hypothetical protein
MSRRIAALVFSLAVISASSARAADPVPVADPPAPRTVTNPSCSGKIVGAVTASFRCEVTTEKKADGTVSVQVKTTEPVKGLKSFNPASFSIKPPVRVQTYSHRDLAAAVATATSDDGKKFKASEKLGDRGMFSMMHVHAHMVPADAADKAELQVDVEALVGW